MEMTHPDLGATMKMPLADGATFAEYTILRLLGSGAMGEVYLAQHPRLPRLDASTIKVTATISRINNRLLISEPKSDCSRRTVPLALEVVAMLRRHRTRQLAEKLRAGER